MKGVVLAGGSGTRLSPLTSVTSKQLLPVFDKPMVYYPISTLMSAGIREIMIICTPTQEGQFKQLLGDGARWGVRFFYQTQDRPRGIADALLLAADFLGDDSSALILGDNLFHGTGLGRHLRFVSPDRGAHVFAYSVSEPSHYGVVELDTNGLPLSIEEKPKNPRSTLAVPGLYFYGPGVASMVSRLRPSDRGELEISDLNLEYLREGRLTVSILPRGTVWLDTGTFEDLHGASEYVRLVENRQGALVGSPEEVAWQNGWIDDVGLSQLASEVVSSGYGERLLRLLDDAKSFR